MMHNWYVMGLLENATTEITHDPSVLGHKVLDMHSSKIILHSLIIKMQYSYASRAPSPRPRHVNAAWRIRLRLCQSCSSWCFMFLPDGLTLMFKVQNLNLSLHCTAMICKTISQVLWLQDNIPEKVDQLQRHVSNWVQEKNVPPNSPSLMLSFPLRCSRWATFCPVRIEFRSSQTWKTGFRFQKHSSGWFKRGKKHQQTQLLIPLIKQRIKTHTHTCFRHFLDTRDVFFNFHDIPSEKSLQVKPEDYQWLCYYTVSRRASREATELPSCRAVELMIPF